MKHTKKNIKNTKNYTKRKRQNIYILKGGVGDNTIKNGVVGGLREPARSLWFSVFGWGGEKGPNNPQGKGFFTRVSESVVQTGKFITEKIIMFSPLAAPAKATAILIDTLNEKKKEISQLANAFKGGEQNPNVPNPNSGQQAAGKRRK
jgi:hypothetical protein